MNQSLFAYIEWVELMTFFSGYVVVFAFFFLLAGRKQPDGIFWRKAVSLLPLSYALVGVLFWGMLLRNWYPGYDIASIRANTYHPFLRIWGMIAILGWIPFLYKKPFISLLYSLVFFVLLVRDLVISSIDKPADTISRHNDIRILTASIGINLGSLIIISSISTIIGRMKKRKKPGN